MNKLWGAQAGENSKNQNPSETTSLSLAKTARFLAKHTRKIFIIHGTARDIFPRKKRGPPYREPVAFRLPLNIVITSLLSKKLEDWYKGRGGRCGCQP